MLLAFIASKTANDEDAYDNIAKARAYLDQTSISVVFSYLSHVRSLVLPLYRNMLRLLEVQDGDFCDLTSPVPFDFRPFGDALEKAVPFEGWIFYQTPGPFEMQGDGLMGNPCIRSCISWCRKMLRAAVSVPTSRQILDICTDEDTKDWAQANAMFMILWKYWVSCSSKTTTSLWMTQTQERMGVSPTELLLLVCRAIHKCCHPDETVEQADSLSVLQNKWKNDLMQSLDYELIEKLRARSDYLAKQSDLKLASAILKEYISRNTVDTWEPWRSKVQQVESARMMKTFEKVLLVRFPKFGGARDWINSVLEQLTAGALGENTEWSHVEGDPFLIYGRSQHISPTLCSSLNSQSSIDFANLRKTSKTAKSGFNKFILGSPPPALNWGRPRSAGSNISDLSRSLRSLSLFSDSASERRALTTGLPPTNAGMFPQMESTTWGVVEIDEEPESLVG